MATVSKFGRRLAPIPMTEIHEFVKAGDTGVIDTAQYEPRDTGDDDAGKLEPPT